MEEGWLSVGDTVLWKGISPAKVTHLEITKEGEAYGSKADRIPWALVPTNAVVDLDNGKWAYGSQIEFMPQPEEIPQSEDSDDIEM